MINSINKTHYGSPVRSPTDSGEKFSFKTNNTLNSGSTRILCSEGASIPPVRVVKRSIVEVSVQKKQRKYELDADVIGRTAQVDTAIQNESLNSLSMQTLLSSTVTSVLDNDNNQGSGDLLEYLEYYLTDKEKKILSDVASDPSYEYKFACLQEQGPCSDAYIDINTYNTIYWAYKNNKLTDWGFMEHYHCLNNSLMFRPDSKLYTDISSNVKSFKIIDASGE